MDDLLPMLTLTLTPGLGPVLIARLLAALGAPEAVLAASPERLRTVKGIGRERVQALVELRPKAEAAAHAELALAAKLGVRILSRTSPEYPPLLAEIADAPPLLYVRGSLHPADADRYPVAIVGSRQCTPYGIEQAERFGAALAAAGLTVVSGGARGIDSAAHRAAARVQGRTIVVQGCGLAHAYPPENTELFAAIAGAHGCVISELPLSTPPAAENFPARNRIISGLSLGVVVIEAAKGSGALITAALAGEEHGRDVFALPGRVDSPASEGSLELLKAGGALLVTSPADVLAGLESPARHAHGGTHAARFSPTQSDNGAAIQTDLPAAPSAPPDASIRHAGLTEPQRAILAALDTDRTIDDLLTRVAIDPGLLRAEVTVLEVRRLVTRQGGRLSRRT